LIDAIKGNGFTIWGYPHRSRDFAPGYLAEVDVDYKMVVVYLSALNMVNGQRKRYGMPRVTFTEILVHELAHIIRINELGSKEKTEMDTLSRQATEEKWVKFTHDIGWWDIYDRLILFYYVRGAF
jgi:hypothetical protein